MAHDDATCPSAGQTEGVVMLCIKDERWVWMRMHGPLYGIIGQHQGWVRLLGWGLSWHSSLVRPLFSERRGCVRILRIGPWSFRWLVRGKIA